MFADFDAYLDEFKLVEPAFEVSNELVEEVDLIRWGERVIEKVKDGESKLVPKPGWREGVSKGMW